MSAVPETVRLTIDLPASMVLQHSFATLAADLHLYRDGTIRDRADTVLNYVGSAVSTVGVVGRWETLP